VVVHNDADEQPGRASNATAMNPTFVADLPGTSRSWIVNDGHVDSVPTTTIRQLGSLDLGRVAAREPPHGRQRDRHLQLSGTQSDVRSACRKATPASARFRQQRKIPPTTW
jgi:hypothetical protein